MNENLVAVLATLLLAGIFPLPYPREVLDERQRGFRTFVSFAAGISLAYVFIDLLPELSGVGDELLSEESVQLPFPEYFVYAAALLGFVLFYGLERLVRWSADESEREAEETRERADYIVKTLGLGAYAGLILFLMNAGIREGSEKGLVAYVVAMTFHFVAMRHSLRYEYPVPYMRSGRWVMAGFCLFGGMLGLVFTLPVSLEALLLGFLGGMLIMNTTVMELPSEREGRFGAFLAGSVLYTGLLMLV